MRSPQTTGEDHPRPGIGVFQATFSVVLQVSGSPEATISPEECGPRNCGQLSSVRAVDPTRETRATRTRHRMSMGEVNESGCFRQHKCPHPASGNRVAGPPRGIGSSSRTLIVGPPQPTTAAPMAREQTRLADVAEGPLRTYIPLHAFHGRCQKVLTSPDFLPNTTYHLFTKIRDDAVPRKGFSPQAQRRPMRQSSSWLC